MPAWTARPIWRPEVDPETVLLTSAPTGFDSTAELHPDRLALLMARTAGDVGLCVLDPITGDSLRIWLAEGRVPVCGAFVLPNDDDFDIRHHSVRRVRLWLEGKSPGRPIRQQRVSPFHRHRYILMLRILDGLHAGASRREIASVLFGRDMLSLTSLEWQNTSQRRHLARLIGEANSYVNGGYLGILRGKPPRGHLFRARGSTTA